RVTMPASETSVAAGAEKVRAGGARTDPRAPRGGRPPGPHAGRSAALPDADHPSVRLRPAFGGAGPIPRASRRARSTDGLGAHADARRRRGDLALADEPRRPDRSTADIAGGLWPDGRGWRRLRLDRRRRAAGRRGDRRG